MVDNMPLPADALAAQLAEVYSVIGPLYRHVARVVEEDLRQDNLSVGTRAVLERLSNTGPDTVSGIARGLALSRQFIQRTVNEAREHQLVDTRRNPAHQRSPLIVLTDAGTAAFTRVRDREHATLGQVGGELTSTDIDTTLRVLRHMLAAVDGPELPSAPNPA